MTAHDNLSTIDAHLGGAFADGKTVQDAELIAFLRNIGSRPTLAPLLSGILDDPASLERIAARSFHHRNEFDKIILLDRWPNYQLRLHIWRPEEGTSDSDTDIHNHKLDFSSVIVCGGYTQEHYEPSDEGTEMRKLCYVNIFDGTTEHYTMTDLGTERIKCSFRTFSGEGAWYSLSHEVLHKVTPNGNTPTATVVLQGRDFRTPVYVYIKPEERRQIGTDVKTVNFHQDELRGKIQGLLGYFNVQYKR